MPGSSRLVAGCWIAASLVVTSQVMAKPVSGNTPARPPAVVTVPFDVYQGFLLVTATVDGHTGTFVLDTGSPVIALNSTYLRVDSHGMLDTVSQETNNTSESGIGWNGGQWPVTIHTVQIGTYRYTIDSINRGPPTPANANAYIARDQRFRASGNRPVLGFLGLSALEPFEVIVDYLHNRLTLIPLDTTGQPRVPFSEYRAVATAALVPSGRYWWGMQMMLGDTLSRVLMLDTGCPFNMLSAQTRAQLASHIADAGTMPVPYHEADGTPDLKDAQSWFVDRARTADTAIVATHIRFVDGPPDDEILGTPFLKKLGVVGFNFRTHRLMTYHQSQLPQGR